MIPGHSVSTVEVAAAFRCSWQLAGKVAYIFSSVVNLAELPIFLVLWLIWKYLLRTSSSETESSASIC